MMSGLTIRGGCSREQIQQGRARRLAAAVAAPTGVAVGAVAVAVSSKNPPCLADIGILLCSTPGAAEGEEERRTAGRHYHLRHVSR